LRYIDLGVIGSYYISAYKEVEIPFYEDPSAFRCARLSFQASSSIFLILIM